MLNRKRCGAPPGSLANQTCLCRAAQRMPLSALHRPFMQTYLTGWTQSLQRAAHALLQVKQCPIIKRISRTGEICSSCGMTPTTES